MLDRIRAGLASMLAPERMTPEQVEDLVQKAAERGAERARQALPMTINYDPGNEGYRSLSQGLDRRDLSSLGQDQMLEVAYYMYDTSGLVKRFARDTRNFVLGEGVTFELANDKDERGMQVLKEFWDHPMNAMEVRLEKRVEFLGLLGEQLWPVQVDRRSGRVWMTYVDPAMIADVITVPGFPEMTAAVRLKGTGGRDGRLLTAIRPELDSRKPEFGRLVGNCFFFSINNPPNGPRGRSDLLALFDIINAFEESLFSELDRQDFIKGFVWDVVLKGADDAACRKFARETKAPKAGSMRVHNEQVEWEAITPDLKLADVKALFDLIKSYLCACMNRPDSWLGSGGKAYQTEAELMGEPTFKDLGSRQRYVKHMLEQVLAFVLDQAVIAGRLTEPADGWGLSVNMPEMSAKDMRKVVDGLVSLTQSLMLAENQSWLTTKTAAKIFATVCGQIGVEIDAVQEVEDAVKSAVLTEDYAAREAILNSVTARMASMFGLKPLATGGLVESGS